MNFMIKNIAVLGAGTMGNGIAHTFAQFGFKVNLIDINPQSLENGLQNIIKNLDRQVKKGIFDEQHKQNTLSNITSFTSIKDGVANVDLVVEAATENMDLKITIFKELDTYAPEHCILASNTSSISITKLGAATQRAEKVIGMHFMNPVPVMRLVEIINGYATSSDTTQYVENLSVQLDKIPVTSNDYPGFIANRILMPMINEAIYTLHEGVADVLAIDQVMRLGMAHPMGPLQLADFIGLDVCLAILEVLHQGFGNPKYAPCPLLINMVNAGYKGIKTGEGFYNYQNGTKELVVSSKFKR